MPDWDVLRKRVAERIGVDLTHAQRHYGDALIEWSPDCGAWLDIGCGRQLIPTWGATRLEQAKLISKFDKLVGLDVDSAMLEHPQLHFRVKGLGDTLPFSDNTFDLVTANMVMEHVEFPKTVFDEVFRVLKPQGRFIFHTPNFKNYLIFIASLVGSGVKKRIVWLLEQRKEEDVFSTFYRSNTVSSITTLARGSGFTIRTIGVCGSSGSFERLGPIAIAEVLGLKLLTLPRMKQFDSSIVAVIERGT